MDLSPYIESLQRDLARAAAPGGAEMTRAADLLGASLDSSARLTLLEVLSEAAAEITASLRAATVEVRLHGREAELVVTEEESGPAAAYPASHPGPESGDVARLTLRLPEQTKEHLEAAATAAGVSVNTWLVRAVNAALAGSAAPQWPGPPGNPPSPQSGYPAPPRRGRGARRLTGYAEA
ncbi:MAG TPA: toxin-antitoxin system HicB family antitoxin [Micromonosporaceae bacterium]|nr:toxin-antitoxin system HicB family antitoxin [Micromonosporaceae bacterium]